MKPLLLTLPLAAALIAGCAPYPSAGYGNSYGYGAAPAPAYSNSGYGSSYSRDRFGVVSDIQAYGGQTADGGSQLLGTAAGALVGGVLGHQVGRGKGKTAATVAGAVAGGLAGNALSSGSGGSAEAWRVSVRLDDGRVIAVDQRPSGLRVGTPVEVVYRGNEVELIPR